MTGLGVPDANDSIGSPGRDPASVGADLGIIEFGLRLPGRRELTICHSPAAKCLPFRGHEPKPVRTEIDAPRYRLFGVEGSDRKSGAGFQQHGTAAGAEGQLFSGGRERGDRRLVGKLHVGWNLKLSDSLTRGGVPQNRHAGDLHREQPGPIAIEQRDGRLTVELADQLTLIGIPQARRSLVLNGHNLTSVVAKGGVEQGLRREIQPEAHLALTAPHPSLRTAPV